MTAVTPDVIRDRVRTFILNTFLRANDQQQLQDHLSLERSHILDSAGMLELMVFIEQSFGLQLEPEDAVPENLDTVNAIVAFISAKQVAP